MEWTTQRDSRALLLVLPTTSRHHLVVVVQQVLRADDHDKCFDENTDEKRKLEQVRLQLTSENVQRHV